MAYREEMSEIASFGEWVRRRRTLMDLTQAGLAKRVGCAVVTIKKIERDERRPSQQMAQLLADHLAIPQALRKNFIRMARGKYVPLSEVVESELSPPDFLRQRIQPPKSSEPHFVARQRELAQLDADLEDALVGNGRVVFILGEAGSGKTTLMAEFARRAQASHPNLIVASGQCNAQSGIGDPYLPFRDVMNLLTGDLETRWVAGGISEENVIRIWELLPYTLQVISEQGPNLVGLLFPGLPIVKRIATHLAGEADWLDSIQSLLSTPNSSPENLEQSQVLEQATQVLRTLAARKPLIILLDDLQWIDSASINLLFHLGRRLRGSQILILGAYRPSEINLGRSGDLAEPAGAQHPLEPVIHEFKRYYGDIQINLGLLEPEEGRAFIDALLDSEPNDLSEEFRATLFVYTQGQPLFTVELLRNMQEEGNLIQNEAGHWVESDVWTHQKLPARIEAVIEQRLGRLDETLREILTVASVEGTQFTAQVVARILELDERFLLMRLSRDLERRNRLVREQGEVQLDSQFLNFYRFGHVLFQEFLYEQLSQGEQRLYHRLIGQTLEDMLYGSSPIGSGALPVNAEISGKGEQPPRLPDHLEAFGPALVRHFWLGQEWLKTARYATWMGMRAMRVYALREAIAYYEQALQALNHLDKAPREAVFDAILRWWEAAFKFRPYQEQLEKLAQAEQIARELDDQPRLIRALHSTANVYLARGLWTRASPALMECLALAGTLRNEALTVRPVYCKALLTTFADPGAALSLLEQAQTLAHRYNDRHIEALAFATMGQMEAQLGAFVPSKGKMQLARQMVDKTDSPLTESDVDLLAGWAYLAMGDTERGLDYSQRSVERAIATDNMDCICSGLTCMGYGFLELQRIAEAKKAFQRGIERSEISGATIPKLMSQAGLAMTQFCTGEVRAIQDLETAMKAMQNYRNYVGAASAAHMLGTCLIQTGQLSRAEEHLKSAINYYRQVGMRPFLARTLSSLAQLYDGQARHAEAQLARAEEEGIIQGLKGQLR